MWDTDNDGKIDGEELRGRASQEEWKEDLEDLGWRDSLRLANEDQYRMIE